MIKLVISDMDGTFLNNNGDFNRDLFKKTKKIMKDKGVVFAPCTGKQCERIEELFGEDASNLWILGDSATRIKHNNLFVYESLIVNELGLKIIDLLEEINLDHTIIACTKTGAYVKETISADEFAIVRRSFAKLNRVKDFHSISEDFIKITVHDPALQCVETREKLATFFDHAYIVASEAAWIDITNANVHKGTTIAHLQKLLNVTPEETMVFGDGYNDLELMASGAYSFAMRNAFPEVQAAANFITGSNEEEAVMKTIIQFLSLQSDKEESATVKDV
ncbi:HAD-IIB family hydrolase [Niallia taxi]|uniref:HAD-IIB family hydrolase n=1 Tax=Niallia taxi TaxID=2499688 RepID=UPI00203D55B4|nr:HAD-IIB family hydrolase [Niallia taxi]MCM3213373.1 HAD-IIB family hydrolase [Niallia taxi]